MRKMTQDTKKILAEAKEQMVLHLKIIDEIENGKAIITACRDNDMSVMTFYRHISMFGKAVKGKEVSCQQKMVVLFGYYPYSLIKDIFPEADENGFGNLTDADLKLVEKALKKLPERQRIIIECRYKESICYREIAEKFGISHETVRTEEKRAKRSLRTIPEMAKIELKMHNL